MTRKSGACIPPGNFRPIIVLPARTSNIIIAGSADSAAKSIQDDFGKAVVKVHGIFGGIGSVPKKISGTPRFAEAASAAAATGTTFIELCRTGTPEAVAAALRSGADVNARGEKKRTALMYAAAMNPNPKVAAALLDAGADVDERNKDGSTALMAAAADNPDPEVLSALLNAGSKVDAKNKQGQTPLIKAALYNSNPEVVSVLSKAGADVNAKDKDGWTALMAAAAKNPEPGVVSALLEAGADIQGKNDAGWTALMAAAHNSESGCHSHTSGGRGKCSRKEQVGTDGTDGSKGKWKSPGQKSDRQTGTNIL